MQVEWNDQGEIKQEVIQVRISFGHVSGSQEWYLKR